MTVCIEGSRLPRLTCKATRVGSLGGAAAYAEGETQGDIAHGNLKNLTCKRMVDLGLSSAFDMHRKHRVSGTTAYMAPEFWSGVYGPEGDVWSCGVVLFVMLTGTPLLDDISPATVKRGLSAKYESARCFGYNISPVAADLLMQMLQHDRHARLSSVERDQAAEMLAKLPVREVMQEPMLKRVARLIMVHVSEALGSASIRVTSPSARRADLHGYGELSISALEDNQKVFSSLADGSTGTACACDGRLPDDLGEIFDPLAAEAMDLNRDGTEAQSYISYRAFLAVTLSDDIRCDSNILGVPVTFRILDTDKDGFIGHTDLAKDSEVCSLTISEVSPVLKFLLHAADHVKLRGGYVMGCSRAQMSSCYPINRDYQRLIQSRIISGTLIPDGIDSLGLGPKRHKGNSDQPSKFANDAAYGKFMKFPSSGSLVMLLDTPDLVIPFSWSVDKVFLVQCSAFIDFWLITD
ncbi:Calcium-dependent protein kinase 1 [Symbiodinium microadriaticum]|uniref:Calcium-dependent protein kinase 1 n=1 Tax=Symbiodinium microadriaticum TaxID=2951 RepID=A0A1Q9CNX3_SYMMI|nr:Calcium-dependent protein kinase 1 [Symbiodinium microadriaticum]